jgi:hypothetical protein
MKPLAKLLERFASQPIAGGAEEAQGAQIEELRRQLRDVGRANERYFVVALAALIGLLAVMLGTLLANVSHPHVGRELQAACGVSCGALAFGVGSLWRRKVAIDMILVLAAGLKPQAMQSVINVLVREWSR